MCGLCSENKIHLFSLTGGHLQHGTFTAILLDALIAHNTLSHTIRIFLGEFSRTGEKQESFIQYSGRGEGESEVCCVFGNGWSGAFGKCPV